MPNRRALAAFAALLCALALGGCTVAPHGKTLRFTPEPKAAATASPAPGALGLIKATPIDLDTLDKAGYFYKGANIICGWLDNDHIAVLGTEPVEGADGETPYPQAAEYQQKVIQDKIARMGRISTKGITGQILSVNWQTGKPDPKKGFLRTANDTVFTGMGLSHDKTKLWYISTGVDGVSKLSVTDISFTHDLLNVPDYQGGNPVWSSLDKYLYYINYSIEPKAARPYITLFNGISSSIIPGLDYGMADLNLVTIDDKTDTAYTIVKNALIIRLPLSQSDQKPATDNPMDFMREFNDGKAAMPNIYKTVWVDSQYVLMMSSNDDGTSSMGILDINSKARPHWYDEVMNFALSDDGKYICEIKEGSGKMAEVWVAEFKNGQTNNDTFICNITPASDSIYFSPDDTKLVLTGWFDSTSKNPSAKVIQIR